MNYMEGHMHLRVSEIKDAGRVERTEVLEADKVLGSVHEFASFPKALKVHVLAQKTHGDILVHWDAQTVMRLTCARCLESFERPLNVEQEQIYEPTLAEIDLSGDIRETVLMEVPYKAVCTEKCQGLCPQCGRNRNQSECRCAVPVADVRLEKLKQFPFQ